MHIEDGATTTESTVTTLQPNAGDFLLAVTGFNDSSFTDAAEIVDLEEPNTISEFMQPAPYPYKSMERLVPS